MHVLLALVLGLLCGGICGYAFRGREHAALAQAGSDLKAEVKKL